MRESGFLRERVQRKVVTGVSEEVSKKNLNETVAALAEFLSGFYPGAELRVEERYYQAWRQHEVFLCELLSGQDMLHRTVAKVGSEGVARAGILIELKRGFGWPLAFSAEEMRLKLSLLPESGLRDKARRFLNPRLAMLKTAPK
jgi:hypothetical protein